MSVTMRQMLEAGVHFGHQTRYWDPKMAPYIFGDRNKIHIINLEKTLPMFEETMKYVKTLAANKGRILFVATKRQAREIIKEEAIRADCAYVNHRWLGGMLTNFKTVKQSIKRLNELQLMLEDGSVEKITKKEALGIRKDYEKLERSIGGIKNMNSLPDAIFVIDVGYESGAVVEATKLGIPIIGVVDTNNSIDDIAYVIPGNDDSMRSIRFYLENVAGVITKIKDAKIAGVANIEEESFVEVESEVEKDSVKEQDTSVSTKKAEADNK